MSFENGLKTIVVATGLEGKCEAALEYARKLATNYGARIVLAHGLDPLEYASINALPLNVRSHLTAQARKVLDELEAELLRQGIHSHSEVRQGAVAEMLLDVARQYQAGLIVIGTKGAQGAGPVVVGAIAEQLVRLSPCPVLAVAADWNAGPRRPSPGGPVLLAMERNESAPAAAATAYSLAQSFARPLLVLHVRTAAEATPDFKSFVPSLDELGLDLAGKTSVRYLIKKGHPVHAVIKAIAEFHPCILVAGVKRLSESPGPHGTAFALLSASRVPILCVPPGVSLAAALEQEVALPVAIP
jgi:nucleotide-binding universal stress UspA family protein